METPRLVKSLDGDHALKVRTVRGRVALIDIKCIGGVIEPSETMEDFTEGCESVVMTSWGGVCTNHKIADLEEILYPFEV
jgi:hypothetical protein